MSNIATNIATVGLLAGLGKSFRAVLAGLGFFLGSFVLLWVNEGRVDLSQVAKQAIEISPTEVSSLGEERLVSLTGDVTLTEMLGDPDFLYPGPYLSLERKMEMYAWVEKTSEKKEKASDGSTKTITEYSYQQVWTDNPQDSSKFYDKKGHVNLPMPFERRTFTARSAKMGVYSWMVGGAELPPGKSLRLTPEMVRPEHGYTAVSEMYLFDGVGTIAEPVVGDVRVRFEAFSPKGSYTLFGQKHGSQIGTFHDEKKDVSLFRLVEGDRTQAIQQLATEHKMITWMLRVIGFLMMWIGLSLVLAPVHTVLGIIPFLGAVGQAVVSLVLLPVCLVLAAATITLSIVLHHTIVLFMLIVGTLGFLGFRYRAAKRKAMASATVSS